MKNKVLSFFIIFAMCVMLMPVGVFAESEGSGDNEVILEGTASLLEDEETADAVDEEDVEEVEEAEGSEADDLEETEDTAEEDAEDVSTEDQEDEPEDESVDEETEDTDEELDEEASEETAEDPQDTSDPVDITEEDAEDEQEPEIEEQEEDLGEEPEDSQEEEDVEVELEDQKASVTAAEAAKKIKRNGVNLRFKTYGVMEKSLGSVSEGSYVWITAQKKSIKVSWTKAKKGTVDGYIILRRNARSDTYFEKGIVATGTDSFTDTTCKKDNGYYYTIVGYKKVGDNIRVSDCYEWAAGMTTGSSRKNGYSATISNETAKLQKGETLTLTLTHADPANTYNSKAIRWYTSNENVVSVGKKSGVITSEAPGTATITGRISSGRSFTCTVKSVGAYRPNRPKLTVEYATPEKIELSWTEKKHATSYELYASSDGGKTYKKITRRKSCKYVHKGLKADHTYKYYVRARNDNKGYTARSKKSAVVTQKAVQTPRRTNVTGFPTTKKIKARSELKVTVTVRAPMGRKAKLQLYEDGKWKTKSIFEMPSGSKPAEVEIDFPDHWWYRKTTWRLHIPGTKYATEFNTDELKITPKRYYQNPSQYVQITNSISTHGYKYYTAPVLVNNASTKSDHIEAMIKTAYKYLGDPYVVCQSREPGKGVDCSGLVMQACYGAGVDLWPCNPYRHRAPAYEYESRNIANLSNLKTVPYKYRKRGDLIFYANSSGIVIHIAIYLGNDRIIHSSFEGVHISGMDYEYGYVCKVKRIFN